MDLKIPVDGKEVILHYTTVGHGPKSLLTFHGFGQSGEVMKPVGLALADEYTSYHFDIFYHGRSFWDKEAGALSRQHWRKILQAFLEMENIGRFDMAAYSMGGKFLLASLEQFPDKTDRLIMMAPDGIKTSVWYSLATYPYPLRKYFQSLIVKPWRFFSLLRGLKMVGLLDKGLAKFASTQMDTRRKRRRVYYSWVMFRHLRFNKKRIGSLINKYNIRCDLYLGKYDKIITPEGMKKLTRHLDNYEVHVLETGHNQLIQHTAKALNANK